MKGQGVRHLEEYPHDRAYLGGAIVLAVHPLAQLHEQVQLADGAPPPHFLEPLVPADGGMVEMPGHPELVEGLVDEAAVVHDFPVHPFQRVQVARPTVADAPDGASSADAQQVHDLIAGDVGSNLRAAHRLP